MPFLFVRDEINKIQYLICFLRNYQDLQILLKMKSYTQITLKTFRLITVE